MQSPKKLQTHATEDGIYAADNHGDPATTRQIRHDARLAHEMLPVLRQLVKALKMAHSCSADIDEWALCPNCRLATVEAIDAATPFLNHEED